MSDSLAMTNNRNELRGSYDYLENLEHDYGFSEKEMAGIKRAIAQAVATVEGRWWITTGIKQNGKKLLGPFATKDLALTVRAYVEKAEAPSTYWVEELQQNSGEAV